MQRGVQVVVFVRNKTEEAEWLQREGLTVRVSERLTFQLVMIDKKRCGMAASIIWVMPRKKSAQ